MDFTEIAGYRVIRRIGAGGMGQVFLVQHPRLPRRDALKLLDAGVSRSDDFKERFRREADMLAQLSHPNIVTLYDRGEVDDRLWIAMEYVDGTDAAELVADRGPLDADLVVRLVGGAGAALDHVWRKRGVTHRDVKPANILVGLDRSDDGSDGDLQIDSVKLADFGIAKAAGEAGSLTATGLTVGTLQYTSPEGIEGQALDNRSDLYSLACTAFHLLTGRAPFDASSITAVLSAHLHQMPPRVTEVAPHLPQTVDDVFARALAKNPDARYDSCEQFVAALAAAVDGVSDTSARPAFAQTMTAPSQVAAVPSWGGPGAQQPKKTSKGIIAAIAALGVVLVAGAAALGLFIAESSNDGSSGDSATVAESTSTTPTPPVRTVTVTPETPAQEEVVPETTWTPEDTVETTTTEDVVPYEGMLCSPAEHGNSNADGTLYCSGMDGAWRDATHMSRPAVEIGDVCSEPGARARVSGSDQLVTCSVDSSGGYSWQG